MDLILNRKSVRDFTDKKVSKENIEMILRCGMAAPSAMNKQPWEFLVIDDREKLDKLGDMQYGGMLKKAPVCIIVCYNDENILPERLGDMWVQDLSSATENMLLSIENLGLGGCWIGVYPSKERIKIITDLIEFPKGITPFSIIALGYPNSEFAVKDKFDGRKIHFNNF